MLHTATTGVRGRLPALLGLATPAGATTTTPRLKPALGGLLDRHSHPNAFAGAVDTWA
jgi:hypothetical protein